MACAAGLASGIREALTLTPAQIIGQLQERDAIVNGRPSGGNSKRVSGRELTAQEFFGGLLVATEGQVEVIRG